MLRVFVETLPLERLDTALMQRIRGAFDGVVLAVRPRQDVAFERAAGAAFEAGLHVGVWPMLDDGEGRWCNLGNAPTFAAYARQCTARLRALGPPARASSLLLDAEPPFAVMHALAERRVPDAWRALRASRQQSERSAHATLDALVTETLALGITVQSAEFPWMVSPRSRAMREWMQVPCFDARVARGSMLYTSLLEGYSRGLVSRAAALGWLTRSFARAQASVRGPLEAQLGAVGTGALGNEPVYRHAGELRQDLERVLAAGAKRVAVFELGGILSRHDTDEWLAVCTWARQQLGVGERVANGPRGW